MQLVKWVKNEDSGETVFEKLLILESGTIETLKSKASELAVASGRQVLVWASRHPVMGNEWANSVNAFIADVNELIFFEIRKNPQD